MSQSLPQPDIVAQQHSQQLQRVIDDEIVRQGGQITFARYMELALYAPGLGYYSAGAHKLGAAGDFITAPELSPLFSHCLAQQIQPVLQQLTAGNILELGAGTGVMAADILLQLAALNQLPNHYFILEVSAELRERQQKTLQQRCPQLLSHVQWLDRLPQAFQGVLVANEVLDALPVHRFRMHQQHIAELYIKKLNQNFIYKYDELSSAELKTVLATIASTYLSDVVEYESEYSLAVPGLIHSLSHCLQEGLILLIDYGFPGAEFYHPDRQQGTLMCHYRHHAHTDALYWPGLQDITAHVDFTQVAQAASAAGLKVAGYTQQAAFLLACGLAEMVPEPDNTATCYTVAQQIKRLTLPHEMGELFKVIALTRNYDKPLRGFMLQDQRGKL